MDGGERVHVQDVRAAARAQPLHPLTRLTDVGPGMVHPFESQVPHLTGASTEALELAIRILAEECQINFDAP